MIAPNGTTTLPASGSLPGVRAGDRRRPALRFTSDHITGSVGGQVVAEVVPTIHAACPAGSMIDSFVKARVGNPPSPNGFTINLCPTRPGNGPGHRGPRKLPPHRIDLVPKLCPVTRLGMTQVVHSLSTSGEFDLPDHEDWPAIARLLLGLGCDWPAVTDLAAMTTISRPAIVEGVTRLAEHTGQELGDLPTLKFWDTVCGLIARSWRLGSVDEVWAIYRMDGLWWRIRALDRSSSQGLQIIGQGVVIKDSHDFYDISREAVALLIEADRLIPADTVDALLCAAVLEAIH